MSMYRRGRRFEYKVGKWLIKLGYYVIRSAGSKGLFDLVAVKGNNVLFIQCTLNTREVDRRKKQLRGVSRKISFPVVLVYRRRGKTYMWIRVGEDEEELSLIHI